MSLKFTDDLENNISRINKMEEMCGNSLLIPYCASDSGARKILANKQKEQSFFLINGQKPVVGTAYENKYGDLASCLIEAESDYEVIAKFVKFSFNPGHHYWLVLRDLYTNELSIVERISYKYNTEVYGYLNNNAELDKLQPGSRISKGTTIKKSNAYDEYNNKTDGVNLTTIYLSNDMSMEDSVVISESASEALTAPLFHPVKAIISENMIPLNLFGNDQVYKCIPDIGESVIDGKLLSTRLEKKEESLFSQSFDRLKDTMMSDDSYVVKHGTVIDIDVYCNKPEIFENNIYTSQLKSYYDEKIRLAHDIYKTLLPYISAGYKMDYQLDKMYYRSKQIVDGEHFVDDKDFNNIVLNIMVLEENKANTGDKIADRHGGKGVISMVVPDELMPILPNGKRVQVLKNKSTMYNRENPGQNFELSDTYIGNCIVDYIKTGTLTPEEAIDMVIRYLKIVSPTHANELEEYVNTMSPKDPNTIPWFLESIIHDDCIHVDPEPISENMDIYKLDALYKEFPWIKPCHLEMPVVDSTGKVRFVKSRRTFVAGTLFTERLKQFAEEKFSVTSLAATTIKNENTRSHASKNYKAPFADTPIKFGQMESDQLAHMGVEYVVTNLMLHSLSPHGRRLVEAMYTGDPFNVDIKLDKNSSNREVEILNAYLKTMGLRLTFYKTKKRKPPLMMIEPISFGNSQERINPITFVENKETYNFGHYYEVIEEIKKIQQNSPAMIDPIRWRG